MPEDLTHLSDEQLARSVQGGDWACFDELVRRYEVRVYRFALQACARNEADAQEVTQETFVSAWRHLNAFDPSRSLATWLFTIARRKCIDHVRRAWHRCRHELPELPDERDPAVLASHCDDAENLWRTARRVLSQAQFQTLWLHYVEDLSVREVARVMHRLQTHVKVTLFRARKALARELERIAEEEATEPSTLAARLRAQPHPGAGLASPTAHRTS